MPIEIIGKPPTKSMPLTSCRVMVPIVVAEIRSMVCTQNTAREDDVKRKITIGDVCVSFHDQQTYSPRILHCRSGILVPMYYADYLLFEYADNVAKVVIAKPEKL